MHRVMEVFRTTSATLCRTAPPKATEQSSLGLCPTKTVFSSLRIIVVSRVSGHCVSPSRLYGWSGVVAEGGKEGKGSES